VDASLRWLTDGAEPGQHLLVVCHGGVIGAALSGLFGLRDGSRWPFAPVTNTSITEVQWTPDSSLLKVFNDDLHNLSHSEPGMQRFYGVPVGLCVESTEADGLEHLGPWCQRFAELYDLSSEDGREAARAVGASAAPGDAASAVGSGQESGMEGLKAWLQEVSSEHGDSGAAGVVPGSVLYQWAEDMIWRDAKRKGRLAPPVPGSCARARVGEERTGLESYNADARR
jgi:hypothetical protein